MRKVLAGVCFLEEKSFGCLRHFSKLYIINNELKQLFMKYTEFDSQQNKIQQKLYSSTTYTA